ncbi:MAG: cytochrome C552 [Bradyrhizobiaceae bacterium]|nr:MAG: cytochrome C552 [Bradyrhizobiaceae bacterium]
MSLRLAVTLALLTTLPGAAALAADAATGRQLAQRWCATCHVVAPEQARASADVPSFAEIASRPGFNADALAFFLLDPHPKMPNMSLTRNEAGDLAAYIATLRR